MRIPAGPGDIEGIVREAATRMCRQAQLIGYSAQVNGIIPWIKESTSVLRCE